MSFVQPLFPFFPSLYQILSFLIFTSLVFLFDNTSCCHFLLFASFVFFVSFPLPFFHPLLFSPLLPTREKRPSCLPLLTQKPLTSAECGTKVIPLSLSAGSGSLCSECLNINLPTRVNERRGEERKCTDTNDDSLKTCMS